MKIKIKARSRDRLPITTNGKVPKNIMNSLLTPRYPGSKRLYDFDDGASYDSAIEPFTGSGITSLKLMKKGARSLFWADADASMRAVYQVWVDETLRDRFYLCLEEFRASFFVRPPEDSIKNIQDKAWSQLKNAFDSADESDVARLAAASICLRKLTFGGVVRASANGKLNVTYCKGQLDELEKWRYRFPIAPPTLKLSISQSWEGAFEALEKSDCKRAFCLIDPPYWAPLYEVYNSLTETWMRPATMTAAYLGHKPHDRATFDLCIDAVISALRSDKIKRIAITNYMSEELDSAIAELCAGRPLKVETVGRLDGINRSRAASTQNREAIWSVGDRAIEQLSLLSA